MQATIPSTAPRPLRIWRRCGPKAGTSCCSPTRYFRGWNTAWIFGYILTAAIGASYAMKAASSINCPSHDAAAVRSDGPKNRGDRLVCADAEIRYV